MDAITLLKNDHKTVDKLFKSYEKAGDRAKATKRKLAAQIIKELSIHAAIEEEIFYPAARNAVEETTPEVLESLEEHHIVKWVLSELEGMDPSDERFDAKVTVLIELVRHHVDEEEHELFPRSAVASGGLAWRRSASSWRKPSGQPRPGPIPVNPTPLPGI